MAMSRNGGKAIAGATPARKREREGGGGRLVPRGKYPPPLQCLSPSSKHQSHIKYNPTPLWMRVCFYIRRGIALYGGGSLPLLVLVASIPDRENMDVGAPLHPIPPWYLWSTSCRPMEPIEPAWWRITFPRYKTGTRDKCLACCVLPWKQNTLAALRRILLTCLHEIYNLFDQGALIKMNRSVIIISLRLRAINLFDIYV